MQARLITDRPLCSEYRRWNSHSGVTECEGLLRAIVGCMDDSVDWHAIFFRRCLVTGRTTDCQVRLSTESVYVPFPRGSRRSFERTEKLSALDLLRSNEPLHRSQGNVVERSLHLRFGSCVQVLDLSIPVNAPVHGVQCKLANVQISVCQRVGSLQLSQFDPIASRSGRKNFARDLAID